MNFNRNLAIAHVEFNLHTATVRDESDFPTQQSDNCKNKTRSKNAKC